MARTRQHVVETLSRRMVTGLLPPSKFVERDQTERDYGIDITVECFENDEPTGSYLLLQIKGTDIGEPVGTEQTIPVDFSVRALKRVERFISPVLLVWCPVNAAAPVFWYVWLQDYIQVELEAFNPKWRSQLATVRIHIPIENRVEGSSDLQLWRLRHIADHPKRLAQFGQLARIAHEARWHQTNPERMLELFREALTLDAIFGDKLWNYGQMQRQFIEEGLYVAELILSGRVPTPEDYNRIGMTRSRQINLTSAEMMEIWSLHLPHFANLLSTTVAMFFDLKSKQIRVES